MGGGRERCRERKREREREREREKERESKRERDAEREKERERERERCTNVCAQNLICNTNRTKNDCCTTPGLTFSTPYTRPGNFTVTKYLIGNVHAVLMIPGLTNITLGHFVTFHFDQPHCFGFRRKLNVHIAIVARNDVKPNSS